jgi:hypothetical protein
VSLASHRRHADTERRWSLSRRKGEVPVPRWGGPYEHSWPWL